MSVDRNVSQYQLPMFAKAKYQAYAIVITCFQDIQINDMFFYMWF